jgi:hypothetical protein
MTRRADSDEHYAVDLCDEIVGHMALRDRAHFDWLRGDSGRRGKRGRKLRVDAFYEPLRLVVEYHERQHSEPVPFFDRHSTISGVSRGHQRRIYDERRHTEIPQHGYRFVVLTYAEFEHDSRKRLARVRDKDLAVVRARLAPAVESEP